LPYFQTPSSLGLCMKFNLTAILLLPFGSVLDLKKRTNRLEAWPSKKQEVIGTGTYVHDTCCVVSRTPSSVVDTSVGDVQEAAIWRSMYVLVLLGRHSTFCCSFCFPLFLK
jgi:hypothetical protein